MPETKTQSRMRQDAVEIRGQARRKPRCSRLTAGSKALRVRAWGLRPSGVLGFRALGFLTFCSKGLGFRGLGLRVLGFRALGIRASGTQVLGFGNEC